jgi:GAF domain-containing protein
MPTPLDILRDQLSLLQQQIDALASGTARNTLLQVQSTFRDLTLYCEQLQGLTRTTALLTSTLKMDAVLDQVIDAVILLSGAERGYVMLYDTAQKGYGIAAARNWNRRRLSDDEIRFSDSIVAYVLQHREPVLVLNAPEDERFRDAPSVHSNALRSVMCLPLEIRGQTIGVLYVDNRITRGIFREMMLPIMAAYADHVAIAIENARLYAQLEGDLDASRHEIRRLKIEAANQQLPDPLSERELEVLILIASGLSNPDIADRLVVEISTIKKHINHIYSKLGVETRTEAIVKAHELQLI